MRAILTKGGAEFITPALALRAHRGEDLHRALRPQGRGRDRPYPSLARGRPRRRCARDRRSSRQDGEWPRHRSRHDGPPCHRQDGARSARHECADVAPSRDPTKSRHASPRRNSLCRTRRGRDGLRRIWPWPHGRAASDPCRNRKDSRRRRGGAARGRDPHQIARRAPRSHHLRPHARADRPRALYRQPLLRQAGPRLGARGVFARRRCDARDRPGFAPRS